MRRGPPEFGALRPLILAQIRIPSFLRVSDTTRKFSRHSTTKLDQCHPCSLESIGLPPPRALGGIVLMMHFVRTAVLEESDKLGAAAMQAQRLDLFVIMRLDKGLDCLDCQEEGAVAHERWSQTECEASHAPQRQQTRLFVLWQKRNE